MSRLMLHPVVGRLRLGGGSVNFVVTFTIFGTFFGWIQAGKVEPGNVYTFQSYTDGHCLTANSHDFHTNIGVFLGQVSSDDCERDNNAQKWGVILWRKGASSSDLWLYPRKNGLNVITAIPDPDEPLPEKNLVEIVPHDFASDAFLIRSLETKNCVLYRGHGNAIAYEPCNQRIKEMLWTANVTGGDPPKHTISDRSLADTLKDFVKYHQKRIMEAENEAAKSS